MGSVQLIYIRADGNKDIAAGHLMRCLTIARELKKRGGRVCFLVSDADSVSILSTNQPDIIPVTTDAHHCSPEKSYKRITPNNLSDPGIYVLQLSSADYRNPEQELPELTSLLQTYPGTLLIDSYFVTDRYLNTLRSLIKVAYLDDLQAFDYPVDLLINYDCFTDSMKEEYRHNCQNTVRMLLGAEYAPLRPQFSEQSTSIREQVQDILITTGSSDPCHFALAFCEKLLTYCEDNATSTDLQSDNRTLPQPLPQHGTALLKNYRYHIVVGSLNSDLTTLKELADRLPCIRLHTGLTDLMPLMLSCDLAITAGGTTLYELCALGIPSLSFSMADNQISNPSILDKQGIIPYAGDIRTEKDFVLNRCLNFITEYASDYEKRKTVHTCMNSLIKGDGALLIADAILNLASDLK